MIFHEHFDKIYYINLEHRLDRKDHIEQLLNSLQVPTEKIKRIPGVKVPGYGVLGAGLSHTLTLLDAKQNGYDRILVLEDDFHFFNIHEASDSINKFISENTDWDVLMFTGQVYDSEECDIENVKRVKWVQTASGYVVNGSYIDKLLNNFREAIHLCSTYPSETKHCPHCFDVYWRKLQEIDNWYCFKPVLGKQLINHSDIAGFVIDREESIS
jgi:hypothetical protein